MMSVPGNLYFRLEHYIEIIAITLRVSEREKGRKEYIKKNTNDKILSCH